MQPQPPPGQNFNVTMGKHGSRQTKITAIKFWGNTDDDRHDIMIIGDNPVPGYIMVTSQDHMMTLVNLLYQAHQSGCIFKWKYTAVHNKRAAMVSSITTCARIPCANT